MLTEKDYCDYETCVALKELGINCYSPYFYDNKRHLRQCGMGHYSTTNANCMGVILAIHLYNAQKWLREEKELFVNVELFGDYDRDADGKTLGTWVYYSYGIFNTTTAGFIREYDLCTEYQTYEEALLEGIKEAIKILKEEK